MVYVDDEAYESVIRSLKCYIGTVMQYCNDMALTAQMCTHDLFDDPAACVSSIELDNCAKRVMESLERLIEIYERMQYEYEWHRPLAGPNPR